MTDVSFLPKRIQDEDGAMVDVFELPTDEASLLEVLRFLFQEHWADITFGPIVQGAAWEIQAPCAPTTFGMMDGYLTIAFGHSHFHVCIGQHKGTRQAPSPAALAQHRRTSRAELYRRLNRSGAPISWGLRLFNGHNEQQITVLLPNPFLCPETDKIVREPDWSRLAIWDSLRARWFNMPAPDPVDRSGKRFTHG